MLIAIFLFTGWDATIYINEETTRKRTNPGKAAIISVAILGPVFAWLFVSFQGVVPPGKLQAHATDALPYLAQVLVGSGWAKFMVLAVVLSVLGHHAGHHRLHQPGDLLDGDRSPASAGIRQGPPPGSGRRCSPPSSGGW